MSPIHLARQLRKRGWRYHRRSRGVAAFGIRFPNGRGVTRIINLGETAQLEMPAAGLAEFLTLDAARAAQFDIRVAAL